MSPTNTKAEMRKKRQLYREIGAEEVWVVDDEDGIWVYEEKQISLFLITPSWPDQIDLS